MKKKLIFTLAIGLLLVACRKTKSDSPETATKPSTPAQAQTSSEFNQQIMLHRPTRAAFAAMMKTPGEIAFFKLPVINHSHVGNGRSAKVAYLSASANIRFRWSGTSPDGPPCDTPLGICLIIASADSDPENADLSLNDQSGQLVVTPTTDDNGLTSDGVLNIYTDVPVDSEIAVALGFKSMTVKAGSYQATWDSTTESYVYTIVDISTTE